MLNSVSSGIELKNPADHPASLLPNAFERNQTPIIKPTMRAGDTLVTALSPTGLQAHLAELGQQIHRDEPPRADARAAVRLGHRSRRDEHEERQAHEQNSPSAILAGTDGSRGPSRTHSHAKIGAKMTTKIGGTDWNQDEGNENPKISRRV